MMAAKGGGCRPGGGPRFWWFDGNKQAWGWRNISVEVARACAMDEPEWKVVMSG